MTISTVVLDGNGDAGAQNLVNAAELAFFSLVAAKRACAFARYV
jgi:hypothetical protein